MIFGLNPIPKKMQYPFGFYGTNVWLLIHDEDKLIHLLTFTMSCALSKKLRPSYTIVGSISRLKKFEIVPLWSTWIQRNKHALRKRNIE